MKQSRISVRSKLANFREDENDGNDDDDLLDLGIQLGKMRITERIGGFFRPKISQEVRLSLCCN